MRSKYSAFESSEQDAFFKKHYSFNKTSRILTNLRKAEHPGVIEQAKLGLRHGIEDFLEEKKAESVYLAARDFCYDDSTQGSVEAVLNQDYPHLENIIDFSKDVCESYRTFVYNESMGRFAKKFKPKK